MQKWWSLAWFYRQFTKFTMFFCFSCVRGGVVYFKYAPLELLLLYLCHNVYIYVCVYIYHWFGEVESYLVKFTRCVDVNGISWWNHTILLIIMFYLWLNHMNSVFDVEILLFDGSIPIVHSCGWLRNCSLNWCSCFDFTRKSW